eukprot:5824215-Prymnesium_polylepis.1
MAPLLQPVSCATRAFCRSSAVVARAVSNKQWDGLEWTLPVRRKDGAPSRQADTYPLTSDTEAAHIEAR